MSVGGEEEPAQLAILEVGDHPVGQRPGLAQPSGVAGRGVELEQPVGQEGVILQVGRDLGLAQAIGPQQAAVGRAELGQQELRGALGGLPVFLDAEDPVTVGIGRDHQPVPGR